ncbi:prepilin-type N-terminal cleavage/methylation domain-containing protein [Alteromonas aestuariivivens]|uniref:Type II secretion system protein H n=1 Tax=Alteromonas aestuariivivens TaxID=1938339 RepID=A0A3D8MFU1_9ALTE|nr:GspH/FimT family pseudopilin [Alteromonas aestuariivivens]RDV29441.1 prepilin-type N-terminal cleavage/methylation domain-containing protein [Alteromonas aestuariivivens]
MMHCHRQQGFTLLELMITIAIIAIVVRIGAPSIITAQKNLVLKGAAESSYYTLQQARSHAVRQSNDIVVDFSGGTNWCIGITDQGDCDCGTANSCTVDGVEEVIRGDDYTSITMQNLNFGANNQATFDGVRGLSLGSAGSIELSDGDREIRVQLNNVGRANVCVVAGNVGTYQAC